MVYLDYSATTPVCKAAVSAMQEACSYTGSAGSRHRMGYAARDMAEEDLLAVLKLLKLGEDMEVIPVSGAAEANRMILTGAFESFSPKGFNHIVTTEAEHGSIGSVLAALKERGLEVDYVQVFPDGTVDIDDLMSRIKDNTFMVTIGCVNGETGVRQPIEKIGKMLKEKFPGVIFHTDASQAIGKTEADYTRTDAISISGHKFGCFKGVGALIKKKDLVLPGQKGTGTLCTELIHAMRAALEDTLKNQIAKYEKVLALSGLLWGELTEYQGVEINSPQEAVPYIFNFSYLGHSPEEICGYMSERGICISPGWEGGSPQGISAGVMSLTGDEEKARSSVRISLSSLTGFGDVNTFLKVFREYVNQ